jgi:hypothetical protein
MVPNSPMGTETRKTRCQLELASSPPMIRPMNDPATAATELTPSAIPRWLAGKASVRIAAALAKIIAPPTPCTILSTMIAMAAAPPWVKISDSPMEHAVKIAKPRLYRRTRPRLSPSRPNETTSTEVTTRKPNRIQSR